MKMSRTSDKNYLRSSCLTAASLMLAPLDEKQAQLISRATGRETDVESLNKTFENLFRLPGSAQYVPPYEHVLNAADEKNGRFSFGRITPEEALAVQTEFDRRGFDWRKYVADMPSVAGLTTADHIGLILLYISGLADEEPASAETQRFVQARLPAIDRLEKILAAGGTPYEEALAAALHEARAAAESFFSQS